MNITKKIVDWLSATISRLETVRAKAQTTDAVTSQQSGIQPVIRDHLTEAFFWMTVVFTTVVIILLVSITRIFEEWLDPLLFRIKRFAPYIMQTTFGVGLILSAYYGGFLGPNLPLDTIFANYTNFVQGMFLIGGIMLIAGIYPRLISFSVLLIALPLAFQHTGHFLQHAIYLGEAGTIFFFGGAYHAFSATARNLVGVTKEIRLHLHKYKFFILRIFFGTSIIASAVYTQLLAPSSIPQSAQTATLVSYFPDISFFLFTVVTIEVLLGVFFIIGFEIRFASIAYLAFLAFSVIFFQQVGWPHIILVGTPIAMLTHGYDKYTVGSWLFSRGNLEPIL